MAVHARGAAPRRWGDVSRVPRGLPSRFEWFVRLQRNLGRGPNGGSPSICARLRISND